MEIAAIGPHRSLPRVHNLLLEGVELLRDWIVLSLPVTVDEKKAITDVQVAMATLVPMKRLPSNLPADWLTFQGAYVREAAFSDKEADRIQRFMRKHRTEALTGGGKNYTPTGSMFALCDPSVVQ